MPIQCLKSEVQISEYTDIIIAKLFFLYFNAESTFLILKIYPLNKIKLPFKRIICETSQVPIHWQL